MNNKSVVELKIICRNMDMSTKDKANQFIMLLILK